MAMCHWHVACYLTLMACRFYSLGASPLVSCASFSSVDLLLLLLALASVLLLRTERHLFSSFCECTSFP